MQTSNLPRSRQATPSSLGFQKIPWASKSVDGMAVRSGVSIIVLHGCRVLVPHGLSKVPEEYGGQTEGEWSLLCFDNRSGRTHGQDSNPPLPVLVRDRGQGGLTWVPPSHGQD